MPRPLPPNASCQPPPRAPPPSSTGGYRAVGRSRGRVAPCRAVPLAVLVGRGRPRGGCVCPPPCRSVVARAAAHARRCCGWLPGIYLPASVGPCGGGGAAARASPAVISGWWGPAAADRTVGSVRFFSRPDPARPRAPGCRSIPRGQRLLSSCTRAPDGPPRDAASSASVYNHLRRSPAARGPAPGGSQCHG